jgi:hypothetical protein
LAHLNEQPDDAPEDDEVQDRDQVEETSRHAGADQGAVVVQGRVVVAHLGSERSGPESEQDREADHDRRVTEREEEADGHRTLALGHELSRGVVNRGDVVGVEGVAHAERVREDPGADAEHTLGAKAVVVHRRDDDQRPADDVQESDEAEHGVEATPFTGRERGANSTASGRAWREGGGHDPTLIGISPIKNLLLRRALHP